MPGIVSVVSQLSIWTSHLLVMAGYVSNNSGTPAQWAISDASNTSPIVITTTTDNEVQTGDNVTVDGVLGNIAANDTWLTTRLTAQTFALNGSVGNGLYTSGGTAAIALVQGKILLGRHHIAEQSASPRIVFIPMSSKFSPRSVSSASPLAYVNSYTQEQRRELQQRAILTDSVTFEVHVWGGLGVDPDADFDATQVLYDAVILATHLNTVGRYTIESGTWADQAARATQRSKAGHEFVFGLTLQTPVLDRLVPFAPGNVAGKYQTILVPLVGGGSETGCST